MLSFRSSRISLSVTVTTDDTNAELASIEDRIDSSTLGRHFAQMWASNFIEDFAVGVTFTANSDAEFNEFVEILEEFGDEE